jgi:Tol biopolymer transport system component
VAIRVVAWALVAVALAVPVHAQSFGRNKVHYQNLDFQILQTQHFDVYYHSEGRQAALEAGRLAERWYARLSRALDHTFEERQPIVLYSSRVQFRQTNIVPGILSDQVGGLTEHDKGRVVLPFAAGLGVTDHVLGHELVHAFQREILRHSGRSLAALPLWFVEGMAEYLAVGQVDSNTAMWLRDSVQHKQLPRIDQLDNPRWFPYRYGQALWVYLAGRFGEDVVARSLKSKASGGAIGRLVATTGVDIATLSAEWHESMGRLAGERAAVPGAPASATVLTNAEGGGRLNVGPSLSPDGKSIVYFSDRDRYSLDVVLADTATGDIRRKLVATAGDPHFESLQFIDSVGTWDPAGNRFALAALSGGRPVLTLLDVTTGDIERELPIENVDQVFNPTWSPDGRQIAFSALHDGFSDLFVLDLESKEVRSLTADPYADLHPAWSPDGRRIAFSTDRFSSSVETLTFGNFRLGLIDVASGTITELPGIANAKNIDPHWSADGASLYFVADAENTSNIYRASIADGKLFRVTDVSTGVSGVTALSPAIGLAAEANQLAFSVYRRGRYEIRIMDASPGEPLSPAPPVADLTSPVSETPAPIGHTAERPVSSGSAMPSLELPDGRDFTTKPYNSRLSLSSMVRPYVSAGGAGAGSFIRGGVALSFGDMLGDHRLQTSVQVGKTLDDFIAQAAYLNMRSRWNWAVVGAQVPWLTATVPGLSSQAEGTIVRETSMLRQLHRQPRGS